MRRLTLIALAIGAAAILAACGSSDTEGLTGRDWQLTAITGKLPAYQGVIPAEQQARFQLRFNEDKSYNGTADCNQIAGKYSTGRNNSLNINPGISTLALCPDGSYGDLFAPALTRAGLRVAEGILTITLEDGRTMVSFSASPRDRVPSDRSHAAPTRRPRQGVTDPEAPVGADSYAHRGADRGANFRNRPGYPRPSRLRPRRPRRPSADRRPHYGADPRPHARAHAQADTCPDTGADPDSRRRSH